VLIGNRSVILKSPGRFLNGTSTAGAGIGVMRSAFTQHGMVRNSFQAYSAVSALPNGYRSPAAWVQPKTAGGLATKGTILGVGEATATAQSGYNIDATITGDGGVTNAPLGLIVSIAAALTASGGISSATATALANMVATITGSSSVTATAAGLATLGAELSGSGVVTANNTALMSIAATIRGYGDLTPEGLRDAVWNAVLESGFSSSDILRLIAAATQGSATGLESGSPVFKSLDGTKDRIVGTYSTGTRTVTSRDAD
jgi:hypothetical protein